MEPELQGNGQLDIDADQDLFSFHVTAGRIYRFACYPSSAGYTSACKVTLLGSDGAQLPLARSSNGIHYHSGVVATQDGTLYARVTYSPTSDSGRGRAYSYHLMDLGPDDFANTPAQAFVVDVGAAATGRIELLGDVDVFALEVVEGRAYRVSCAGLRSESTMKVRDPQGEELEVTRYQASPGFLAFNLTGVPAGRYTVEVGAGWMFLTHGIGDYTFSVDHLEP